MDDGLMIDPVCLATGQKKENSQRVLVSFGFI
jgi:hypothetical protein